MGVVFDEVVGEVAPDSAPPPEAEESAGDEKSPQEEERMLHRHCRLMEQRKARLHAD